MNLTDFMDWGTLGTYAGALAMVLMLTQLTKNLSFTKKIPTQIWSYILAVIVLLAATFVTQGTNPYPLFLCFFNAVIVSAAANGSFAGAQRLFGNATDGELLIDTNDPVKDIYRFAFDADPIDLVNKTTVTFKVNNKSNLNTEETNG